MTRPPRSLLSNTLASGAATLWAAACVFVTLPVLIRLLGADRYGLWVLLGVVLIPGRGLASLLDLGLQQSLVARVAAADPADAARRLGAGLRVLACVGLAAAGVLAATAPWLVDRVGAGPHHTDAVRALRLLALQLCVDVPAVGLGAALEGLRRYELRRGIDAVRVTLTTAGTITVAATGGGLTGLAMVSVAAAVLTAVALAAGVARHGLWPARGASARTELRHGLPLLALRASGVGYRQLDRIVLGVVVGAAAVSGYDVADKVNLAGLTALGIATSALIPVAAHGLRHHPDRTRRLAREATRWAALVAAPLVGFALGAAAPLARVLAGDPVPGTAAAIRWLAFATAVALTYAAAFEMAIGAGAGRRLVTPSLVGLTLNLVATVLLARRFGLPGSAAATFLATLAVAPAVLRACGRSLSQRPTELLVASAPAAGLAAGVAAAGWAATRALPDTGALAVTGAITLAATMATLLVVWRHDRPAAFLAREATT